MVEYANGDVERSYIAEGRGPRDIGAHVLPCPWREGEYALVVLDGGQPRAACAPHRAEGAEGYRAWLESRVAWITVDGEPYFGRNAAR